MSSLVIAGDTSGTVTLQAATVAGSNTITLPALSGTSAVLSAPVSLAGQIPFCTDGSTLTPTAKIVQGTAQASTSGTVIDFTSIPSWVKRITVMFSGVSTSGTSNKIFQLGSGSATTSGYLATGSYIGGTSVNATGYTTGFGINSSSATDNIYGSIIFTNLSGNTWTAQGVFASSGNYTWFAAGSIALSNTLDRVRVTTVNGTDTFDAGSVNILYE